METDKINEICSLAAEFIQELKEFSVDDYLRIKLIMLAGAPTYKVKAFMQLIFCMSESRRPLLISTKEVTL